MAETRDEKAWVATEIAKRVLYIETLERRFSDHLDFHDLGVVQIKQALMEAYEAGRNATK